MSRTAEPYKSSPIRSENKLSGQGNTTYHAEETVKPCGGSLHGVVASWGSVSLRYAIGCTRDKYAYHTARWPPGAQAAARGLGLANVPTTRESLTHLVDDPITPEPQVPQAETHVLVEAEVHAPAHPAYILQRTVDAEAEPAKRDRARARKVVQIALRRERRPLARAPLALARVLVGPVRKTLEGAVMVRVEEGLGAVEHLVVVHELLREC